MSADVRAFTADLMLAGGNGIPDLHLSALDPIGSVSSEFDARAGTVPVATTASADVSGVVGHALGLPSVEEIKAAFKGALVVAVMVVLGILLVALGAWQLTKD